MVNIVPSNDRHSADHGWLKTHWHFSFGDYYDPANMNWGPLRVFNDDIIEPGGGFGEHPHRDMEIVSWVIDGQLEHGDRLGHREVISAWDAQVMSAGKGIVHSERNPSKTKPMRLIQLWMMPRSKGAKPRYDQRSFDPASAQGKLLPIVSSGEVPGTLAVDQDATIFISKIAARDVLAQRFSPNRKAYLFVIDGAMSLNGQALENGDQARIDNEAQLQFSTENSATFMLLDLPA